MRRWLWSAGLLAVVGLGAGCAHDEATQARIQGEKLGEAFAKKTRFADQLSLLNQEQIVLGTIALQQSQDPEVRRFAEDLIRDHQRNQEQLEALARSKMLSMADVDVATRDTGVGGSGLEGTHEGMEKGREEYDKKYDQQVMDFLEKREKLSGLSGREFDKAFLEEVKKSQERGEKLIDKGMDDFRDDTTLAVFLGRSAPVIDNHQQRLETLKGHIGE